MIQAHRATLREDGAELWLFVALACAFILVKSVHLA
jgi:hypothetical protein